MGIRTLQQTTLLMCFFLFSTNVLSGGITGFACSVKMNLINWVLYKQPSVPVSVLINQWGELSRQINVTTNGMLSHQTSIDGERIIRDMSRKRHELKDVDYQRNFFNEELSWCVLYMH